MTSCSPICVVDDDSDVRLSIRTLLESAGFTVMEYGSSNAFLSDDSFGASCLVADTCKLDTDGQALLEEVSRRHVDLPVVLISGHDEHQFAARAMRAGAAEVIEKPFDKDALLASVQRAVAIGERARLHAAEAESAKRLLSLLTPRESQVLNELVGGMTNRAAAEKLRISPRTIEVHRTHIGKKLNAKNLADLVRTVVAGTKLHRS